MFWLFWAGMLIGGCSYKRHIKRLESAEKDHYAALRVFMKEEQKKEFLIRKTKEERDEFLKQMGIWDKFYSLSEKRREDILNYDVKVGWNQEELLMSWGTPYRTRLEPTSKAVQSQRWTYKFEEHYDKKKDQSYILIWEPNSKTEYKAKRVFARDVIIDDNGRPEYTDNIISEIIDR